MMEMFDPGRTQLTESGGAELGLAAAPGDGNGVALSTQLSGSGIPHRGTGLLIRIAIEMIGRNFE